MKIDFESINDNTSIWYIKDSQAIDLSVCNEYYTYSIKKLYFIIGKSKLYIELDNGSYYKPIFVNYKPSTSDLLVIWNKRVDCRRLIKKFISENGIDVSDNIMFMARVLGGKE